MFEALIDVKENFEVLNKLFETEQKEHKRSSYEIKKTEGNFTQFLIKAEDIAAFRATLNAITQALAVHQKMKNVEE